MCKEAGEGERGRGEGRTEERVEQLLQQVTRKPAPPELWGQVARSLTPEAVATRRLARRRRRLAEVLAVAAASLLLLVGLWHWLAPGEFVRTSPRPPVADRPSGPGAPALTLTALEQEVETLGQVHLVYEASNVLSEEMVFVAAGEGDDGW